MKDHTDYNKTTDEINGEYGPREGLGVVVWIVAALAAVVALCCWLVF